jgi:hypothetical protein
MEPGNPKDRIWANEILRHILAEKPSENTAAPEHIDSSNALKTIYCLLSECPPILPSEKCCVLSSSHQKHPQLSGCLHRLNCESQFIFHTYDENPWVLVDFGEQISIEKSIYLYNRCQTDEISERIIGCKFWVSESGQEWQQINTNPSDEQIYAHQAIEIKASSQFRYLMINRYGGAAPIHLSQITVGLPLESNKALAKYLNSLLAKAYNLQTYENGTLVEDSSLGLQIGFRVYDSKAQVGLNITGILRFSNFLIQLTNAIYYASEIGIRHIYLPDNERVRNLLPHSTEFLIQKYSIIVSIGEQPVGTCLEGLFFHSHTFRLGDKPSVRSFANEFREHCGFETVADKSQDGMLTIHIRSGDIFENDIHPSYGQPPLSFYLMAIAHYGPKQITLVFENESNPVIPALISYLKNLSLPFCIQSSCNLREDIAVLTNAQALVIGTGTFANGIIALSTLIRQVYTLNEPLSPWWQGTDSSLINTVIVDAVGEYTSALLMNNWCNTSEQRKMMLSYGIANLAIRT